ncbi:hypothetical protein FGG08_002973 [Glutinoglossum americanum]|uniref:NAD-dependent epimerase/dehydratase domain-containing protein n=1 Tax=Glutinoglossum americanum TaxID=1670608 RepID=A0A9P8I5A8_9PEZI|nr:hypothetical protein FGG08_002973 [Glutinoglossum americanum]
MAKTLVTGANGFVAAHVVDSLVKEGHEVVGSVRRDIYGDQLLSVHPEWKGKVTFVNVSDYTKEGAWDEALKEGDFDYVLHIAAPMPSPTNQDFDKDFLEPTVKGNLELLKSASKYGKNLKSIVVTGSVNSITYGNAEHITGRVFTHKDWLPTTVEEARAANHYFSSYATSKKYSEQALWDYVEKEKPSYTVTVFLPCLIFGPPIHYVSDINKLNYTSAIVYSFFNGSTDQVSPTSFPSYIDVRDVVDAHILALTTPGAANKRLLIGGSRYTSQLAADVLRKVPELEGRVVSKDLDESPPVLQLDVSEAEKLFGKPTRTPEATFGDTARKILELERELGGK